MPYADSMADSCEVAESWFGKSFFCDMDSEPMKLCPVHRVLWFVRSVAYYREMKRSYPLLESGDRVIFLPSNLEEHIEGSETPSLPAFLPYLNFYKNVAHAAWLRKFFQPGDDISLSRVVSAYKRIWGPLPPGMAEESFRADIANFDLLSRVMASPWAPALDDAGWDIEDENSYDIHHLIEDYFHSVAFHSMPRNRRGFAPLPSRHQRLFPWLLEAWIAEAHNRVTSLDRQVRIASASSGFTTVSLMPDFRDEIGFGTLPDSLKICFGPVLAHESQWGDILSFAAQSEGAVPPPEDDGQSASPPRTTIPLPGSWLARPPTTEA